MRVVWCKDIESIVSMARNLGLVFHYSYRGKHYYYVFTGTEAEIVYLVVEAKGPLKGRYTTIDEDGNLVTSDKPIMPACARVVEVEKDESFEALLK